MRKILALLVVSFSVYSISYSQPANDDCSGATAISIPASGSACVTGTTVGATSTTWPSNECGQTTWTNDVWFTFVSTGTLNTVIVSPTGNPAAQKIGVSIYTGSCANDTFYSAPGSCVISATNGGIDTVSYPAPVGTIMYVEVSSFGTAGRFQLCVTSATEPNSPGNKCSTAAHLCGLAPFTLATVPAGGTTFTPDCFVPNTPAAGQWYQFSVGVTGLLAWQCTPTTPTTVYSSLNIFGQVVPGNGVELDWALYDITNGCPTNNNQANEVACNFNYEGQNSYPIGMSTASGTTCPINADPGTQNGEFCPALTITAGKTYALFINNFTNNIPTGWNFNFNNSSFVMAPVDTFLVSPDTICGNTGTVNITNNSQGAVWQKWNFGDGNSSLSVNPGTHAYNATGTYFISLIDSSQTGCTSVSSKSVLIAPYPTVAVQNQSICPGNSATLTAVPSIPGGTYVWNTGATTVSITASPATTSTYTVTYTSAAGCTASATATITVSNNATANITPPSATICPGSSTTFTASGGTTYIWSNGATTASVTVSPVATTTYTVTVTAGGGCSATGNATATVANNSSTAITPSSATTCPGVSTTLTAGSGTSYVWSNGSINQTITVTPLATTTYTVTVTIAGGCTATASATITVSNTLTTAITPQPDTICPGSSTTLTAASASAYLWNDGSTTGSITVSPAGTSNYSVTVTSGTCTASASAVVTVTPFTISISPDSSNICGGHNTTVTLSCSYHSTNVNGYLWSNPQIGTTQGVVVSPASTTTYSVTVSNTNNCTASASAIVVVGGPTISITPPSAGICAGQTTTLTASGANGYAWSNGVGSAAITISPSITTKYIVTGIDAQGCTSSDSAVVSVITMPIATFTVTSPLCTGQNGAITYTGSSSPTATYIWNFGGGNIVSGTNQGPYQVNWGTAGQQSVSLSVTDSGCTSIPDTMPVTVNVVPAALAGNDATYCNGSTTVIGTASTADYTYLWSPVNGLSSSTVSNPTVSLTNPNGTPITQAYIVTTTNNGCSASDTMTLTINPVPAALFAHQQPQCLNVNKFNFAAIGNFFPTDTFAWTFGANATPPVSTSKNQQVTYSAAQTAIVSLTISQSGCISNTYVDSVIINPMPVAAFSADSVVGCPDLNVCFINNSTSIGNTSYLWTFGDGQNSTTKTPCHVYVAPGTYTVGLEVTANNCSVDSNIPNYIKINSAPVAKFIPDVNTIQQPQSEIDFTNLSSNALTYMWNFGSLGSSTDINPIFNFTEYGLYNVVLNAYNTFGCSDSFTLPIKVLAPQNYFIPNIFTPNNDGNNDDFYIQSQEGVTVLEFTVFDRWGEKVHDGQYPWDGTYKGKPCPNGIYVYIFKLRLATNTEGIKRTGSITLMR